MLRSAEERCVTGAYSDPRVAELHTVVARLRRELAAHPAELSDRAIAEEELAGLAAMLLGGSPDVLRLRRSLLLIAGAIGSVSALAPGVGLVREAVESFGDGWAGAKE
ncbi:DUF5955 family protein [Streptomyces sp. NBC_00237]|uniref:DUF5955 family protein n=1 Tax=Streptomyces sp. NBC_00237 TaxID=2975687 RepID=UPI0022522F7D|nr:DUF5955 family protein [Streptomyces sp. NBC_00237]MCX5203290.1 DUF5955 family protein [Streptomyces sp. NBC_00237]